jgi:hypothetical protein
MRGTIALGLLVGIAPALGACSNTREIFRPFDADRTSVSADAKQRFVLSVARGPEGQQRRLVCAEPSPDATSAVAASLGADLGLKLPGAAGGAPVTTEAELAIQRAIAEQVAYIGVRNATIQLLRDGLYRACEAYMNGALGDFGYALVLTNYGRVMTALVTSEGLMQPRLTPSTVLTSTAGAPAGGGATAGGGSSGGGTAGAASAWPDKEVMLKGLETVRGLADPYQEPRRAIMDVVVACTLWAEGGALRTSRDDSPLLRKMCGDILADTPFYMGQMMRATPAPP